MKINQTRLSLILTFIYLFCWFIFGYFGINKIGFLGFPIWFEISALFLPVLFLFLCYFSLKKITKS